MIPRLSSRAPLLLLPADDSGKNLKWRGGGRHDDEEEEEGERVDDDSFSSPTPTHCTEFERRSSSRKDSGRARGSAPAAERKRRRCRCLYVATCWSWSCWSLSPPWSTTTKDMWGTPKGEDRFDFNLSRTQGFQTRTGWSIDAVEGHTILLNTPVKGTLNSKTQ
jgi:hypothetical protein